MPKVRIGDDDVALNYREAGSGTPLVLLHGFPFSSALWRPQLEVLATRCRVIAPDFRGFGESEVTAGPYTMERLADDTIRLLDALGVERAVICGLSMGGYVAFALYRHHPERVRALILADTRAEPDTEEGRANRDRMAELALNEGAAALAKEMLPHLLSESTRRSRAPAVSELRRIMESADPRALAAALKGMAVREDARPVLERISVPTLVIVGREDEVTPPAAARALGDRIADARVEIIDDAGHVSNLEAPERFNTAVAGFLDSIGERG